MGSQEPKKSKIPCEIDTLPDKLTLPRSYVKKIISGKKLRKENKDEVVVRCQDDKNDDFQLHLRAGMTDFVDKCLEERGLEILNSRFTINLTLREVGEGKKAVSNENVQKETGAPLLGHIIDAEEGANTDMKVIDNNDNEYNANIHVNALLLSILTEQRKSVECILKYICRQIGKGQSTCAEFKKVLGKRVEMENVGNVTPDKTHFIKYDSVLDNMNLFHLSCYYYPEAIEVLQELCCSTDKTSAEFLLGQTLREMEMVEQHNDNRFNCTPLHIAAGKSYVKSARILISTFEADVDALDVNNCTPLHHASKYGNENIVWILLKERADLTIKQKDTEETPLHLARTPKIARLLLDYGADPNAINKKGDGVLTSLMEKNDSNDDVAKVIMDDGIETNGAELDSKDLLVVYNMDFFKNVRKGQNEFSKVKNMAKHESNLLYHPLSEAMIRLKWSKTWKVRHATNILKTIFAASFTFFVIGESGFDRDMAIKARQFENDKCESFLYIFKHPWSVLAYFTTCLTAVLHLFSEIYQLFKSPGNYLRNGKNLLDLGMISCTIIYLVMVVYSFCEASYEQRAIAAISIFLAWVNIIFMISGFPKVGIYIHMFMNVSRTLLFFLLIYSPAVIAFALSFRVLMPPEVKAFDRLWISFLKTMAMLVGELDYDGTFINNDAISSDSGHIILIQIMSILFLCFGSIVIMNLLVGLTVSEIDKLKSEAWQVGLEEMFTELLSDETVCCKGSKTKEKQGDSPILDELLSKRLKDTDTKNHETLKICVKPNAKETESENRRNGEDEHAIEDKGTCHAWNKRLSWLKRRFIPEKCKVYFYDATRDEGDELSDTGFRFEKGMIETSVKCLREEEEIRKDLDAQSIDWDIVRCRF